MSLNSNGQHYRMLISETNAVDTRTGKDIVLPSVTFYQFGKNCDTAATKEAFMKLMDEFSNSKQFQALFYELQSSVQLNIEHLVHTSM